jgi:hypothetical protein
MGLVVARAGSCSASAITATPVWWKYAPDLMKHPFYVWLNNRYGVPLTVLGIAMLASVVGRSSCGQVAFGLCSVFTLPGW